MRQARARDTVGRAILRRLPLLGTVLGLALGVWLVVTHDLQAVADAFGRIGPLGLVGIVLVRGIVVALCGIAWARLLRGLAGVEAGAFLILRFVREGINVLLPVASVGGDVVGGRLLTFWGVAGALAAASILVDMLMQVATQGLFALLGVGLLTRVGGGTAEALTAWTAGALAVTAVIVAAFFAVQRSGAARALVRRSVDRMRRWAGAAVTPRDGAPGGVYAALDAIWATSRRRDLAAGFFLHLLAWGMGAVEIWIALACIGIAGVTWTEILVIEALSQAIKSAAFPVPSGLGVQEGGFVLLGGLFGLDPGTALALSLAKRVPDVVLGVPALVAWQMLEARRATVIPPV
ncbi:lysylphosphatidylglycerol synthase domain-containing protein [Methylobacterium gossipiicola]|uniref:Putative membrane protein n=1 Tax=Methylobacterium gossipiicola TaxID=582675 RepID=A0A1I2UHI1_9HYPH|nr:lysylphosphatidylglycerol synthase domain-containing protein [Methylobacterium gossipiicola]SFG76493.1 putative membrane protein [Methylobacterium gossipiicola]